MLLKKKWKPCYYHCILVGGAFLCDKIIKWFKRISFDFLFYVETKKHVGLFSPKKEVPLLLRLLRLLLFTPITGKHLSFFLFVPTPWQRRMACQASGLTSASKKAHSSCRWHVRHCRWNKPNVDTLEKKQKTGRHEPEVKEVMHDGSNGVKVCHLYRCLCCVAFSVLRKYLREEKKQSVLSRTRSGSYYESSRSHRFRGCKPTFWQILSSLWETINYQDLALLSLGNKLFSLWKIFIFPIEPLKNNNLPRRIMGFFSVVALTLILCFN